IALFVRQIRQVTPTAEGRAYFAQIQPAITQIVEASRRVREGRNTGVRLSMPPSLAAKWFAPRMADFLMAHPQIALNLSTSTAYVDFGLDAVDLAIRYFNGVDDSLSVHLLYADEARVYCSPSYAKRLKLKRPDDMQRATLLHNTLHPHWPTWLRQFSGLSEPQIAQIAGLHVDQSLIAIEAAVRAQGVVLTSALLTRAEVADGSLIDPFGMALPLPTGYYLVHPRNAELQASAQTLKAWLIETVQASNAA
ncbi:LysR substrate-binding domain-containing protein, partial [Paraburkholderia sp.]|uniref:LysR substrate-binding domain-containing protein n=1 Tax=Paraburkholderia sp. TaxID=1926495 RepID=UPI002F42CB80